MECLLYARHCTKHFHVHYFIQLPQHDNECKHNDASHLEDASHETDTRVVSLIIPHFQTRKLRLRDVTCACFLMTKRGLKTFVCLVSNLRIKQQKTPISPIPSVPHTIVGAVERSLTKSYFFPLVYRSEHRHMETSVAFPGPRSEDGVELHL